MDLDYAQMGCPCDMNGVPTYMGMGSWLSDTLGINLELDTVTQGVEKDIKKRVVGAVVTSPEFQQTAKASTELVLVENAAEFLAKAYYKAKQNPVATAAILGGVGVAAWYLFFRKK